MSPNSWLMSRQLGRRTRTQRLVLVQRLHVVVCIRRDSLGAGLLGSMEGTQGRPGCNSFLILPSRSGVVSRVSKSTIPWRWGQDLRVGRGHPLEERPVAGCGRLWGLPGHTLVEGWELSCREGAASQESWGAGDERHSYKV